MIPEYLFPLGNHLWQSTVFAAVVGLLTLMLRKDQAKTRHRLWLIASLKFLVPFSLLIAIGGHMGWRTAPAITRTELSNPGFTMALDEIGQPFPAVEDHAPSPAHPIAPLLLPALWLCGCAGVLLSWCVRWRRIGTAARGSVPLLDGRELESLRRLQHIAGTRHRSSELRGIELKASGTALEPGAFGLLRPVLLLPRGIADCLTDEQLEAIIAHELCHILRRDNLTAAIHMIVEAVFWFHPLVWWLGARLVEERERACDEEVLRLGSRPEVYAEGILTVCKFYLESPLACVAGVTGSSIKRRIEAIMSNRVALKLNFGKKLALTFAGIAAVAVPIAVGIVNAPRILAQSAPVATPKWEVASIKPCAPGGEGGTSPPSPGRMRVSCYSVTSLIRQSYVTFGNGRTMNIQPEEIVPMEKSPAWVNSDLYTIEAKAEINSGQAMMLGPMMQALLEDRFKLKIHRGVRQVPVYALTVGKDGFKLPAAPKGGCAVQDLDTLPTLLAPGKAPLPFCGMPRIMTYGFDMRGATMAQLSTALSSRVDRKVIDKTGIAGMFDIRLDWSEGDLPAPAPPPAPPGVPPSPRPDPAEVTVDIQSALQKAGLKLEPIQGPTEFLVIDHVERPSEN